MSVNVYQKVTDRIVELLNQGVCPWRKAWFSNPAINYVTRKPYSLLNQFLLNRGGEWLTFNQIRERGGHLRAGSKGGMVVFFKFVEKEDAETGERTRYPILKYYHVYHLDDCEGIESKIESPSGQVLNPVFACDSAVAEYISRDGVTIEYDDFGNRAYYSPASDKVVVPGINRYRSVNEYYATLFHELVHSTGAESRLNRGLVGYSEHNRENYSREELVAEIGANMLLARFGLDDNSTTENNAAYIAGWLRALQNDNHMIVVCASQSEKAVKYFLGELDAPEEEAEAAS